MKIFKYRLKKVLHCLMMFKIRMETQNEKPSAAIIQCALKENSKEAEIILSLKEVTC